MSQFFSALRHLIIQLTLTAFNYTTYLWIEDEEILSNLTPIIVNDTIIHEFDRIIREMVEMSPIKTILFMARYQGGETEIIQGVIPINNFLHSIKKNEILFNVCYIVKG